MKKYIPAIIVSVTLLLIAGGFSLAYERNQAQQRKAQKEAVAQQIQQQAHAESLKAVEEAQQQQAHTENLKTEEAQQTKKDAKKAEAKKALENCLANVNHETLKGLQELNSKPLYYDISRAVQGTLQVQETFTAQCQATYNAAVGSL